MSDTRIESPCRSGLPDTATFPVDHPRPRVLWSDPWYRRWSEQDARRKTLPQGLPGMTGTAAILKGVKTEVFSWNLVLLIMSGSLAGFGRVSSMAIHHPEKAVLQDSVWPARIVVSAVFEWTAVIGWSFMIGCAPLCFPQFWAESEKQRMYRFSFGWFILPYFTLSLSEKQ